MGSNPTLCATSEQAIYRLLRFLFKNQSALMPLLLLFRKKSRLLRLFACKRAHDASAALPIFCGASAVIFGQNNHIANSMQKRLKRLFFLWHFKLMGVEAAFLSVFQSEKRFPGFVWESFFWRDALKDLSSFKKCSAKIILYCKQCFSRTHLQGAQGYPLPYIDDQPVSVGFPA